MVNIHLSVSGMSQIVTVVSKPFVILDHRDLTSSPFGSTGLKFNNTGTVRLMKINAVIALYNILPRWLSWLRHSAHRPGRSIAVCVSPVFILLMKICLCNRSPVRQNCETQSVTSATLLRSLVFRNTNLRFCKVELRGKFDTFRSR